MKILTPLPKKRRSWYEQLLFTGVILANKKFMETVNKSNHTYIDLWIGVTAASRIINNLLKLMALRHKISVETLIQRLLTNELNIPESHHDILLFWSLAIDNYAAKPGSDLLALFKCSHFFIMDCFTWYGYPELPYIKMEIVISEFLDDSASNGAAT